MIVQKGIEQRTLFFLKNGFQSVQELQRVQYVAVKEYVSYLEKLLNVFAMITIMEKTVNLVTNGCAEFILLQVVQELQIMFVLVLANVCSTMIQNIPAVYVQMELLGGIVKNVEVLLWV